MLATLSRWRRGFKSHRGRLFGTVRNQAKRRSSNLRVLWVRLPPVLLKKGLVDGGQWIAREMEERSTFWLSTDPYPLSTSPRIGWALACHGVRFSGGCNPPAFGHWRFNSVPTHSIKNGPFF